MKSRKQKIRTLFQLESLEGRIALSSVHGMDDHGHHRRGAEVEMHRHRQGHGQDDPAGHNANDNHGAMRGRNGLDDPPGHDANEHRGLHR